MAEGEREGSIMVEENASISKKDFWQMVEDWRAQAGFDLPELTPDEVNGWRERRPAPEFSWPD